MHQLNPKAVWFFFLPQFFGWFVVVLSFGFIILASALDAGENISIATWLVYVLLILFILAAFIYIWARLKYKFYRFDVSDNGLHIELGIIIKKYILIPYEKIQNVNIYRGILARILGLSDISFETAGSASTEGKLPALSQKDAAQIQSELVDRIKQSNTQSL